MKVSIELSEQYTPPYAVIYADAVTDEVRRAVDLFEAKDAPLIAHREDRLLLIKPDEVSMIRVESGETAIYTNTERYVSKKRLYEILRQLGGGFLQISKQTIVNLSCIQSVEAGFSGTLLLKLDNGQSDYVSRKYLPEFKRYLGL